MKKLFSIFGTGNFQLIGRSMFQTLLQDVRPSITVVIRSQDPPIFLSLKAAQLVIHR